MMETHSALKPYADKRDIASIIMLELLIEFKV